MTTSGIKSIPHGISHTLKATIKNFELTPNNNDVKAAPYEDGFHTLFSLNFLDYFMRYNTQKNPDWVKFKINQNNFKTSIFKFRLVDLEFLF
jgi:hypothetical protein